jgi:thioredoxin 1
LCVAKAIDTSAKPNVFFGAREQIVGGDRVGGVLGGFEFGVRTCDVMPAALVAGGVTDDGGEIRRILGHGDGQLVAERELHEGAERVLHAIDGVFGAQALASREVGELSAFGADEPVERIENVFGRVRTGKRGHRHDPRCRRTKILRPVRFQALETCIDMGKSKHVVEVGDATFDAEVLAGDRPVLVEFGAAWCPPCRALDPIVDALAEARTDVKVVKVDVDASPEVSARYRVRSAPTVLVFRDGKVARQHVGLTTREKLELLLVESG